MKKVLITGAFVAALAPMLAAHHDITLRGCVTPGVDKDSFVLTQVSEVEPPDGSAIPADARGRRVVFWLTDDKELRKHAAQMVEVRGEVAHEAEESEIEVKAGPGKDGGLIVEFEGPGKDVTASNAAVGDAIGTSGRTEPGKDIKTLLIKVDVDEVKQVEGSCQK
jgi:hypothetical protein